MSETICHQCGIEAPTELFCFRQNIGLVLTRVDKTLRARLCKRCCHRTFWSFSGITFFVGWLEFTSLVVTPIYLVGNVVNYLKAVPLEPVPDDAELPELSQEAIAQLHPFSRELLERRDRGEDLGVVASDLAAQAGTTPGQVIVYLGALLTRRDGQREPEA